jgi:hypothetical protein
MQKEGDGTQNPKQFKHQIEKVLQELIGDMLPSVSTKTPTETECLWGMQNYQMSLSLQMGLSLFNWLKQELGQTRFQCQLYSTLTALS